MSSFKQMLIEEVIQPVLQKQARVLIGIVENYDEKTNFASVRINDPGTGTDTVLECVPVVIPGGIKQAGPMPGQTVLVDFVNGQHGMPVVVGLINNAYMAGTRAHSLDHQKHGTLMSRKALNTRQFVGW